LDKKLAKLQTAKEVLTYLNLTTVPIAVEKICDALDIAIIEDDLTYLEKKHGNEIAGLIYLDAKKDIRAIFVNEKDPFPRQRFTVAHELGHFFLHLTDKEDGVFVSFRSLKSPQETEANKFASDLLMPAALLKEEHKKAFIATAEYFAELFEVSRKAMQIRLNYLGLNYV